jgi:glycosyltransferase involved in cell wall biosynthesis
MGALHSSPVVRILGTRGLPAAHGGFETFAERLAVHLVSRGWRVIVYGQEEGRGPVLEDVWQGVERVRIPVRGSGAKSTIVFDWLATRHAASHGDLCLTLGYNTAVFCALLRLRGVPNLINMDGIEWARAKWGLLAKSWFWLNDWAGCWLGDHLVADHPEIKAHLVTRVHADRISTIPYGADRISQASDGPVRSLGLEPGRYLTVVARPEPENSLLEVVQGFSRRPRGVRLVVLGHYDPGQAYQQAVLAAASEEVLFPGAIYDPAVVQPLRFHSLAYVHGHRVGGTNPSLVEALGAGNAVLAHDNRFNRWVAGAGARYFDGADAFDAVLDAVLAEPAALQAMKSAALARFQQAFTWPQVLADYERLLTDFLPGTARPAGPTDTSR